MSITSRLGRLLRDRRNAVREPKQDPREALAAAQRAQQDRLDGARRAVADLAAQRRRVELLAVRESDEIARLGRQAEEAVARGDDAAAREHLRGAIVARERREKLQAEREALDGHVRRLQRSLGRVEERVEESRVRVARLRAGEDAARAAREVREAARASGQEAESLRTAALQAEREARRIAATEAGHAELAWSDADAPQVREALEQLQRDQADAERRRGHRRLTPPPPAVAAGRRIAGNPPGAAVRTASLRATIRTTPSRTAIRTSLPDRHRAHPCGPSLWRTSVRHSLTNVSQLPSRGVRAPGQGGPRRRAPGALRFGHGSSAPTEHLPTLEPAVGVDR
ncbi:PspA/IM30 family protein [Georgenia sp. AZ-5]|uniref:PspA/IM30 family protein n=1 Tax=Georgenia sp. AZ-5 TaxID=3367526 RepID=UPI00375483FF